MLKELLMTHSRGKNSLLETFAFPRHAKERLILQVILGVGATFEVEMCRKPSVGMKTGFASFSLYFILFNPSFT